MSVGYGVHVIVHYWKLLSPIRRLLAIIPRLSLRPTLIHAWRPILLLMKEPAADVNAHAATLCVVFWRRFWNHIWMVCRPSPVFCTSAPYSFLVRYHRYYSILQPTLQWCRPELHWWVLAFSFNVHCCGCSMPTTIAWPLLNATYMLFLYYKAEHFTVLVFCEHTGCYKRFHVNQRFHKLEQ